VQAGHACRLDSVVLPIHRIADLTSGTVSQISRWLQRTATSEKTTKAAKFFIANFITLFRQAVSMLSSMGDEPEVPQLRKASVEGTVSSI
jgi:hypothetical protein